MKIKPLLNFIALSATFLSTLTGVQAASISGRVFFDFNGNGLRDTVSEYGLPQRALQLVPVNPAGPTVSVTTDVNGHFSFGSLAAGDYTLSAVNPSPWLQTHPVGPPSYSFTLAASDNLTGKDFGCKQPVFVPQIEWEKAFGGNRNEAGGIIQTRDGGYLIGGSSWSGPGGVKTSPNYGGSDFWVVGLDASGNQQWDRSFGGSGDETMRFNFEETPDGGVLLAGATTSGVGGNKTSSNFGGSDIWVVRLDKDGNKLWEAELGGTGNEGRYFGGLTQLRDGGVLIVSYSSSGVGGNKTAPNFGGDDGWVVKLDANGNKQWDFAYGGPGDDYFLFASENPDGTILLSGDTTSAPASGANGNGRASPLHGVEDYWLVKISSDGTPIWDANYGGNGYNEVYGFARTPDGGAVLAGWSDSDISGNKTAQRRGGDDGWVVKVDADGNKQWDQSYGGGGGELLGHGHQCRGAIVMPDGRIVLAGYSTSGISGNKVSPNFGTWDSWVVVTDANGNPLYDLDFGGSGDFQGACGVSRTIDGGLLIMRPTAVPNDGNVSSPHYGGEHVGIDDILVIKLAPLTCAAAPVTLLSAAADCAQKKITLNFSAPLNPASALQAANYTITGGPVPVQAASFGGSTLQVVLAVPALLPGVTYTVAVQGLVDDCGNAIAANTQLTAACPGEIRGRVFSDQNVHDCVQGSGEFALVNWPMRLDSSSGQRFTLTDPDGNYSFTLPPNTYTISAVPAPNPNWLQECPANPSTYGVLLADGQIAAGNDFALMPAGPMLCPDLRVLLTANYPGVKTSPHAVVSTPCCGAKFTYRIDYENRNTGNQSSSATIGFAPPVLANPNRVTICGFSTVGPTVTAFPPIQTTTPTCPPTGPSPSGLQLFAVPPLPVGGFGTIFVQVLLCCDGARPCPSQDQITLDAHAVITPPFGVVDCASGDNTSDHFVQPCCSSDPNHCTVTPKGCGVEGLVNRGQTLTYLVQFQNVGGGAAHLVVVRDVLDAGLDASTLEVLGSSHPNILERNGRELTWTFPNVELASVSVDENASHGYVKFRIRPLANAPVGTVINNNAEITFDVNEPITTITTVNTITEDPVPKAAFAVVPHHGSASAVCDFTYTGGTPGAQCQWYFGPDAIPQTSTALNPANVSFTTPGPHLVSLQTTLGNCAAEPAIKVVTVGQPMLSIAATGADVGLSWQGDGFVLEEAGSLTPPVQWQTVQVQPTIVGGWYLVNVPVSEGARFYRLAEAP